MGGKITLGGVVRNKEIILITISTCSEGVENCSMAISLENLNSEQF